MEATINCPNCTQPLTEVGTADSPQNRGGWFDCQHCGKQYISLDSDGTLSEYKPLPMPKMKMNLDDE